MKVMAVIGLNQKWMQYVQGSVLVDRLKGATAFVINAIIIVANATLNLNALNLNTGIVVVVRIDAAKNKKQKPFLFKTWNQTNQNNIEV